MNPLKADLKIWSAFFTSATNIAAASRIRFEKFDSAQSKPSNYTASRLTDRPGLASQPADKQFALVNHFGRQVIVKIDKKFLVTNHLSAPEFTIDSLQLIELLA